MSHTVPEGRAKTALLRKAQKVSVKPPRSPDAISQERDPMRMFKNDKGELEISKAGSQRITQTFLGLNAPTDQDNTLLDNVRLGQTSGALPCARGKCGTPESLNVAVEGVAALAARDGMEVMLCSQLVALHSQSMEFLRRGMLAEETNDGVDRNVNRATKLLRTFATMADCLRTYRGGGQQRVTVEHVTVQAGGQAIVGAVNQGVGGGDA